MKWDDDPYIAIKWQIFDQISEALSGDDAEKTSMKTLMEAIDEMFLKFGKDSLK